MNLSDILKDSNYKLTQFTPEQIETFEKTIFQKEVRGKEEPFINCLVRRKDIQLKPEEAVRQLYLMVLNEQYGYPYKSSSYIKENGVSLIRINNIKKGYLALDNAIHIPKSDLQLSTNDIAYENDILISMSGTIGNSCKIPKGVKAVVNQRIMKITPKNFNNEVLPLVINSVIGELQLNRIGTGGVQTNISSTDIRKIFIPKLKESTQEQIAELIEQSFSLKKQSEHLLEVAKRAVEIAIEENENMALAFIKKETA